MKTHNLQKIQRFASELSQCADVPSLLDCASQNMAQLIDCERASVALIHEEEPSLFEVFAFTGNKAIPMGSRIPLDGSSVGASIASGNALLTVDLPSSDYVDCKKLAQFGLNACINAPLYTGGEIIGSLNVGHADSDAYCQSDVELLAQAALVLAVNLESRRLVQRLTKTFELKQLVLNTVEQGFALLNDEGRFVQEYSHILTKWFGQPNDHTIWSWFKYIDPQFANDIEAAWQSERKYQNLPTALYYNGRTYQFIWRDFLEGTQTVVSVQDVTDARLRMQAEKDSREKLNFLTTMSHELRTPLNAIIGYSELICEELDGHHLSKDTIQKDLNHIQGAGQHLLRLVDSILDFSKIEMGEFRIQPCDVNLTELIQHLVASMSSILEERNQFELIMPDDPIHLHTDPIRLRQVLWNLLSNAAKFTNQGSIQLRVVLDESHVNLFVKDTGVGIPASLLDKIFHQFEQIDATSTRLYDGVGLGLFLCAKISKLLGAQLTVESTPGTGSTFCLSFPR